MSLNEEFSRRTGITLVPEDIEGAKEDADPDHKDAQREEGAHNDSDSDYYDVDDTDSDSEFT